MFFNPFNILFIFILLFELFLLFELKFRLVVSSDNIFWVFGSVFIGSKSPGLKILSFNVWKYCFFLSELSFKLIDSIFDLFSFLFV